ncbi:hypothetical protein LAZ67_13000830, partial [Cordylochernes scorpioides]
MTYLAKVRKCDLSKLAYELGEVVPPESRIVDLKRLILNSQSYEEEFAKQLLETLIEEREQTERAERERMEQTAQTEQAERIERKRIEDRERIERKEQMVMEFELEKLRIQTTRGNNDTSRSTSNDAHYEIRKLMPKYESKDNDLSFYLILFERQAKRLGLDEDQWAFSLLGLLPYEMTQLIARETEEQSGDYRFVKRLLLKRYKLSPEQFRQKFEKHERSQKGSWRDFAFELRGYFNEWIEGMNVENFDALKDLSVTNQLKKKVPNVLRNHLIDDWTKLNNPDELADKLDEYENVRTEMGPPHWNAKHLIPPSFQQKSARFPNQSEVKETKQGTNVSGQDAARNEISETYPNTLRRMVNRAIRNDKGEPKCFNCNQFGHIARDCPAPRTTLTCRGCGQTGHKERNCTRPKEGLKVANLEVEGLETVPPDVYLKDVKIDNKETVKAMIDTGSSSCLMRESVARRISVDIEPDSTSLYGIGNQTAPAARTVGKTTVDLEIDGIVGREITVFIVNDDAQPYDLLIGRTWTDLPYVSFARIGKNLHIGYSSEFPFANLQEEIKSRRIELRATETVQLESDSINFTSAITDEVKDGYVLFTGVDDACVDSLLEVVDGKTTVPIISAGKGKLRVRKNQCVGRVELLNLDDIVVNLDVAEDSFQTKNEEKREGQDQMKRKRPILPEDINVNQSLTSKERQEILDVVNEYRDCFALGMEELGCTDVTKMDIKEVDGSKPVCLRPYKTTASEREAIREIVREWKDNGIVTETRSPYASPVLLVRKKTGDHRLVVDYRRLNIQTVKDKFPLPRIDDLLEGLRNAKFFTTLDLAHGYLQIPLTDKAKLKTAFITPDDTGQFERMIFGLANAPAEFQRLMHTVLGPLLNKKAFCYLDDVIIPAKDWREMIERLREVLERIRSAKLTLKSSKCEFGRREVEFLGYVISTGGLKPGPRKIKAIEEFPEPKNVHDIRRFLGLTNFFRRFVKDFARKAEPLSRLTKKGSQFEWKEEQRRSFGGLRKDLVEYPVLAHYNPELKTEVHCDASAEGLAGMVLQMDEDCKWRLVYCVSKKTTEAEKMYHSSKLELMAIVWTLDRLRQFLVGIKFTVVTDCQALVYMNAKKTTNPQIARWYNLIQEYDFEIRHKPGEKMAHVDGMSRAPVDDPRDTMEEIVEKNLEVCLTITLEEQILMIQHSDPELRDLIQIFRKDPCDRTVGEQNRINDYSYRRKSGRGARSPQFASSAVGGLPRYDLCLVGPLLRPLAVWLRVCCLPFPPAYSNLFQRMLRERPLCPEVGVESTAFSVLYRRNFFLPDVASRQGLLMASDLPWDAHPEPRVDRMDERNETQDAEEYTAEGGNNPAVSTPKIEPPPPSAELPAVLTRLAACLSALQTTSDRVTHRTEIEVQSFDGTYPAAQFFRTYDQKTDWDGLTNTEKVLRLPRYLNNKPLEHFRRLRMETQHYIQVRQTFLDLYPETNEATYAQYFSMKLAGQPNLEEYYRNKTALGLQLGLPQEVILETLTEGLPPSDQRLVRIVPPENLGAWFRLVQRIRGSGAPSPRHPDEHAPPLLGPYAPTIDGHVPTIGQITFPLSIHAITQNEVFHVVDAPLPFGILGINTLRKFKLKIDFAHGTMYQLDAPLSPLTYHFAVLPERCTYWECQADLCKAHTIFPPSASNTQYAHFSDNTSTTQGLTQPPHHVQSKNFFRANCSYYRVKVPEQPPNANLSHPTKVQTDHLHHTPKHPHSTHHSMYHTHHPLSPEHLPGIPIDKQPQPPYPPQFPALLRQYQHVFSRNKFAVPCLKVPPVRIATNSDKVVTIRPYRVPICDQREIRSQIRQMLDNDIIEPSYSRFSSPVTLVTKRDKTKRFCIDYRKVNEVISSDVHPLPRIEDILDRLARAKYFSTADVSSAYWQVPIHPDSRPLLAFATIDGLYQPTRLPFGLKTSPQIYERAINQVLQGHGLDCVAHYFDDFVIYSETLEEHQEHLRRFFAFCDAENLQLNLTKCEFFRQTIEFLGYTITAGTTTPLIRNTDVIHAIPPPNNRKTLQSFLGAVNVYNKFIPDYARLRTPLNNLLKKDVTWDWDDKCQKAFTSLKESLTQHPVLHLYKDELPCQVYCDASTLGIAGVLKQVHSAGKAYPVQYFSRALRVHERNYTISELECLAIVESVEKFRVYLMGRKFTIFSDHHALQWLKTIKNPSGRLFRWSLRLSCYEYEVRYIKGSLQHEADLLSRNPFCGFLDATIIKNHQLTPSGESKLTIDRNGLQTLKRRGVTKIVVPDALVPDLLTKVHSRYNHPGISQMTRLISPQYYWKGMSEDISKTTKACAICQSTKHPRGPTFGELGQLPVATQPFDLVALDTIAGLAKYGNAKTYLHVVVDHFSRYTWTFPSKSTSLTTYQQVIKRVLQDGSPKRLLTDRAPAFTSPKFRKFLINRNIHPLLTTSNNPQANGLCERLNATLTGKLRLLHLENPKAAWTKLAKRVTVVYNNTPHSVTGFPPGYLMFGVLPPELTEHVNPYPVLTTARRIAHERTQAKHLKDKHAYDQQHKTPHFEPGDLVLVKVYHHPNTGKLAPYFTGPYEILEIISPNVVRINRPNQPLNRNTDTVHVNKLQYYNENIRYIAPPTLIPHPAKPQSRTLPPLFEHLTPDLFTVERFAPTIGNCTTTTPVDPQCNIIAQRDIPQPAISRPTHITKVKTPIPTVRADPKPIPLQARFFRNVKTFPLFHLLYLINLFILPTVLLPMATLLYVSVYTLQPNRLFQLQEALFEITIAVVELIHRTIGIILPELWTILVHSHALVALI